MFSSLIYRENHLFSQYCIEINSSKGCHQNTSYINKKNGSMQIKYTSIDWK